MGKITILPETTKNPISLIGQRAGVCVLGSWYFRWWEDKKEEI